MEERRGDQITTLFQSILLKMKSSSSSTYLLVAFAFKSNGFGNISMQMLPVVQIKFRTTPHIMNYDSTTLHLGSYSDKGNETFGSDQYCILADF